MTSAATHSTSAAQKRQSKTIFARHAKVNNIIGNGAEAVIYREGDTAIKERISKSYRLPILDFTIRSSRTRKEAKLLAKASPFTPPVLSVDEKKMQITMQYIPGTLLRDALQYLDTRKQRTIMRTLGSIVAHLHSKDIIHGDLTSSNILLHNNQIYLIDFGLGCISAKIEDKAVDLHLLRQALQSKHYTLWEHAWKSFLNGYTWKQNKDVLTRLTKVSQRGRYKRNPHTEKSL